VLLGEACLAHARLAREEGEAAAPSGRALERLLQGEELAKPAHEGKGGAPGVRGLRLPREVVCVVRRCRSDGEAIATTVDGVDVCSGGLLAEGGAQVRDGEGDRGAAYRRTPPHLPDQLVVADEPAAVVEEVGEEVERARLDRGRAAVTPQLVDSLVELEFAEAVEHRDPATHAPPVPSVRFEMAIGTEAANRKPDR